MRLLPDLVTNNWSLKLAAAALAILLWSAVRADAPARVRRAAPVIVELHDPEWRLAAPPQPETLSVTLSGPYRELLMLSREEPRVLIPVDQVSDSVELQVVPPRWVRLSGSFERTRVEALNPQTVRLVFEPLETRMLPVSVPLRGDLPPGVALEMPLRATPPAVAVRGPPEVFATLDSVPLEPLDISELRGTTNVPLTVDTAALRGLRVTPREVNVLIRVMPLDSLAPAADTIAAAPSRPSRRRGAS